MMAARRATSKEPTHGHHRTAGSTPLGALLILTGVTGLIDALSYLGLGRVFVATTTVLTLTLTGLAADSVLGGGADAKLPRRLGSVVAMFAVLTPRK